MRYLKCHPNSKVKYIQGLSMRITEISCDRSYEVEVCVADSNSQKHEGRQTSWSHLGREQQQIGPNSQK